MQTCPSSLQYLAVLQRLECNILTSTPTALRKQVTQLSLQPNATALECRQFWLCNQWTSISKDWTMQLSKRLQQPSLAFRAQKSSIALPTRWMVLFIIILLFYSPGYWYSWSGQPVAYIAAFRGLANVIHATVPGVRMLWSPNSEWKAWSLITLIPVKSKFSNKFRWIFKLIQHVWNTCYW